MSKPFLGQITLFPYNFAPFGWALCQGQLLSIAQNTALFSLLGTQFGGDGRTTFALPDLRGRVPIGQGSGPGLCHENTLSVDVRSCGLGLWFEGDVVAETLDTSFEVGDGSGLGDPVEVGFSEFAVG